MQPPSGDGAGWSPDSSGGPGGHGVTCHCDHIPSVSGLPGPGEELAGPHRAKQAEPPRPQPSGMDSPLPWSWLWASPVGALPAQCHVPAWEADPRNPDRQVLSLLPRAGSGWTPAWIRGEPAEGRGPVPTCPTRANLKRAHLGSHETPRTQGAHETLKFRCSRSRGRDVAVGGGACVAGPSRHNKHFRFEAALPGRPTSPESPHHSCCQKAGWRGAGRRAGGSPARRVLAFP